MSRHRNFVTTIADLQPRVLCRIVNFLFRNMIFNSQGLFFVLQHYSVVTNSNLS